MNKYNSFLLKIKKIKNITEIDKFRSGRKGPVINSGGKKYIKYFNTVSKFLSILNFFVNSIVFIRYDIFITLSEKLFVE